MSDALLTRIAAALETLAASKDQLSLDKDRPPGFHRLGEISRVVGSEIAANKQTKPTTAVSGAASDAAIKATAGPKKAVATKAPRTPPGGVPKLSQGVHDPDEVKKIVLAVVAKLGKAAAENILDEEASGARNIRDIKPEDYDKVYEACENALRGEGDGGGTVATSDEDLLAG